MGLYELTQDSMELLAGLECKQDVELDQAALLVLDVVYGLQLGVSSEIDQWCMTMAKLNADGMGFPSKLLMQKLQNGECSHSWEAGGEMQRYTRGAALPEWLIMPGLNLTIAEIGMLHAVRDAQVDDCMKVDQLRSSDGLDDATLCADLLGD